MQPPLARDGDVNLSCVCIAPESVSLHLQRNVAHAPPDAAEASGGARVYARRSSSIVAEKKSDLDTGIWRVGRAPQYGRLEDA